MGLIVQFLIFLQLSVVGTYHPDLAKLIKRDSVCYISYLTIEPTFNGTEGCKSMFIQSVNITEPSKELLTRLTNGLDGLCMRDSNVDSFDLPPTLRDLEVLVGGIGKTKIIIDKTATYKLEKIWLKNLPRLPDDIGRLHSLKRFISDQIYAATIDFTEFNQMTQLEMFTLRECSGLTISNPVQLPALQRIHIEATPITVSNDVPCEFLRLEKLHLRNTSLSEIPKRFTTCPNLTDCTFSYENLGRLSLDVFADMGQLEMLNLENNQISAITARNRVNLPRLKNLILEYNYLTELDTTLWVMPALRTINLSYNLLKRVEGLLALCSVNMKYVEMMHNPWDCEWLVETCMKIPGMKIFVVKKSCYAFLR